MRVKLGRAGSVFGAFLLLTSMFTGAMGGAFGPGVQSTAESVGSQATPVETAEAASLTDAIAGSFLGFSSFLFRGGDQQQEREINEVIDQMQAADANETETSIHNTAAQTSAANEQFLAVLTNYGSDSSTVAFSKGEAAAVKALANGANESEAMAAFNQSVEDYATHKQVNLLDRWNVVNETVATMDAKALNTTNVSGDFVTIGRDGSSTTGERINNSYGGTTTTTLLNGSSATVYQMGVVWSGGTSWAAVSFLNYNKSADGLNHPGTLDPAGAEVIVRPTDSLTSEVAVDAENFHTRWKAIQQRTQRVKDNGAKYINQSLAPAVQSGELNATSYVSPSTLVQEYSTNYNQSGYFVQAVGMAAAQGYATPSLNATASMTIAYNGSEYTGMVLSQEGPSGGAWETSTTYDPALLSGKQFFAVAGANTSAGEKAMLELTDSFTVTSIENPDGEEIENATVRNIEYVTTNQTANYSELQEQIRNLSAQIEASEPTAGAGGSLPGDVPDWAIGAGAGVALMLLSAAVLRKD